MSFAEKVYEQLKKVPEGRVTTYKDLALSLNTKAFRAVGQVLRRNPYAPAVPCHRVVKSDGTVGGFMGDSEGDNVNKKIELLNKEGVRVHNGKIKNFKNILFNR